MAVAARSERQGVRRSNGNCARLSGVSELDLKHRMSERASSWDGIVVPTGSGGAVEHIVGLSDQYFVKYVVVGDLDFAQGDFGYTVDAFGVEGVGTIGPQRLERELLRLHRLHGHRWERGERRWKMGVLESPTWPSFGTYHAILFHIASLSTPGAAPGATTQKTQKTQRTKKTQIPQMLKCTKK